jgi:hypothetical protein
MPPVYEAIIDRFGSLAPDVARGPPLRHDWGPQYRSGHLLGSTAWPGASPMTPLLGRAEDPTAAQSAGSAPQRSTASGLSLVTPSTDCAKPSAASSTIQPCVADRSTRPPNPKEAYRVAQTTAAAWSTWTTTSVQETGRCSCGVSSTIVSKRVLWRLLQAVAIRGGRREGNYGPSDARGAGPLDSTPLRTEVLPSTSRPRLLRRQPHSE